MSLAHARSLSKFSNVQTNFEMNIEMESCFVVVQSKDDEKSSQKGGTEVILPTEDSRGAADQDEQSCGTGNLEVSTNRTGTTSERRMTRAAARSQQQRGRSSADGMAAQICRLCHRCRNSCFALEMSVVNNTVFFVTLCNSEIAKLMDDETSFHVMVS